MHVRRCADPYDVDVRRRNQFRPVAYRYRRQRIFAAEAFRALYVEFETATISTSEFFLSAGKWRVRTMLPAPTIPIRNL